MCDIWRYDNYKGFIFTFHQGNLTQKIINFDVEFIQLIVLMVIVTFEYTVSILLKVLNKGL